MMKTTTILLAAALAVSIHSAQALSGSWTGNGSDGSWNNNSNWTAAFPVALQTATFNAAVLNSAVSMNGTAVSLSNIGFTTDSGSYIFNAAGGSLTLSGGATALTINANTVGNLTQTFNVAVSLLSATSNVAFTNNGTSVFLDLAGGVNSGNLSRLVSFTGTGNGGRVNGITQSGGNTSVTVAGTGTWELTGSSNASGNLTISNTAGAVRITGNLSSTAQTALSGFAQINNSLASGGLSTVSLNQSGTLEAFGADRTINTGVHTLQFGSTFAGSNSLTIGSLTTMAGGNQANQTSLLNNISGADKRLIFTNANFYLSGANATLSRTIGGTGTTEILSNISNNSVGGTLVAGINKRESGTLILSGNNTYTGTTSAEGGAIVFNSSGAMATGEIALNGGVIGLGAGNFTRNLTSGPNNFRWIAAGTGGGFAAYGADRSVNIGGNGTSFTWNTLSFVQTGQTLMLGAADSTHKLTYVNPLGLGNATRTIQVADGTSAVNVDGEFSGVISGAGGGINKTGTGTLLLSAANTYTGLTTVSGGALLVGNSSGAGSLAGAVTVSSNATLGGSGTIAGAVTIQNGATLAPGNSSGLLTVNNNVTIENGGIFSVEINGAVAGTGYDRLVMTGAAPIFSLTGTNDLRISLGYAPAPDALFFLAGISGSNAISGIFESLNGVGTSLTQGSLFTVSGQGFNIGYTGNLAGNSFTGGNDLVIQAVPEPSTWMLPVLGGILLLFRRWARRSKASAELS